MTDRPGRRDRPAVFSVPEAEPPPLPLSSQDERQIVEERENASRRRFLKWMIRVGYVAFGLAFALPALALRALSTPKSEIAIGDRLVLAAPTDFGATGQPLRADSLTAGTGVQVFPANKTDNQNNLVAVVRIAAGTGAEGLVAYSAICTHLGCAVYARLNEAGHIACPCHNSQFDPADGAKVVNPPATRPLPSLPISVDAEGIVVVDGGFSDSVGPD